MNRFLRIRARGPRVAIATLAIAGFATAASVGIALAKSFTLQVAKNAQVTNQAGSTKSESIAVTPRGRAVYTLSGDSARHPECTKANSCFTFWPPVTVSSAKRLSRAPGIKGRLGTWRRNGFLQLTLAGHPLYRYAADSAKDNATGEGVNGFGGTWHVVKAAGASAGGTSQTSPSTTTPTTTTPTTTTTTTTTTPCPYPGYC